MAKAFVQSKGITNASATSHAVTLDDPPTEGNLLVVCMSGNEPLSSFNPPATFDEAKSEDDDGGDAFVACYWKVAGAAESDTVTFTLDSAGQGSVQVFEFSGDGGTWTLDKTASNDPVGAGTSCESGSTGTLTAAAEVAVTACVQSGNNGGTEVIDSSFVIRDEVAMSRMTGGYLLTAATTALNPSHSWLSSTGRAAVIATFYEPAASGAFPFTGRRAHFGLTVR